MYKFIATLKRRIMYEIWEFEKRIENDKQEHRERFIGRKYVEKLDIGYLIGSLAVSFHEIRAYFGCFINLLMQIRAIILGAHCFQEESTNRHFCEANSMRHRTSIQRTVAGQEP